MNRVPYSMLLTSNIQAVGALSAYRLNTSAQTTNINTTISQAAALPTQVLMWSAV